MVLPELRQVVTEGGPQHVVNGLWRYTAGRIVVSRPAALRQVGVLDAPANTTLWALVELMPEAQRELHDVADVAGTGTTSAWCGTSRWC